MIHFARRAFAVALVVLSGSISFAHSSQGTPELLRPALQRYIIHLGQVHPKKVRDATQFFAAKGIDVAGVNFPARTLELLVTDYDITQIEQRFHVQGERVLTEAEGIDSRYLNYASLEQKMRALANEFPKVVTLHEIGRSTQGRSILALRLTQPTPNLKPAILFDGNHHAREIMTPEVAFDVAEFLAKASVNASLELRNEVNDVLTQAEVWVVPMMNPDGNNIVWTSDSWWRKNAAVSQGKVTGVDINRNYTFQWGKCNGSSSSPTSDTYRGPQAGSEPEIQAIMGLADKIKPVGNISFHSYGEMVLSPYGCEGQFVPERQLIDTIGKRLAESLPRDSGQGKYAFGTSWQLLYSVDGASKDYFYAAFGTASYTIEINTSFQPNYELREPTLKKHRVAWMGFINDLIANTATIRVASADGQPIFAKVEFAEVQHQFGERPFTTNQDGVLHKVLAPGKYHVRVTAQDGRVQEAQIDMASGGANALDIRF